MKKFLFVLIVLLGIQPGIATTDGIFKIKSDLKKYLLPYKVEVHTKIYDHLTFTKTKQFFNNAEFNNIEIQYGIPVPVNVCVIYFNGVNVFKEGLLK